MKWKEPIKHILIDLLFIGAGIQIILGLIWLFCNFTGTQLFPDTLGNTYYGFLYPAFVWVLQSITKPFGIPWYSTVYLLQLGLSFYAVFSFVRLFFPKRFPSIWFTMGILTLPALMQVNLAVLPDSLVFSLYLFMIGIGIKAFRSEQQMKLHKLLLLGVLWITSAMLQSDYGIVGATVLLIFLLCQWREKKNLKEYLAKVAVYLLLFCLIMGAVQVTERKDYHEAPSKSIGLQLVSRFAWPEIDKVRRNWPEELYSNFDDWRCMQQLNGEADCIFTTFGPACRELVGADRAEGLYFQMVKEALSVRSGRIVKDIVWDGVCYIFAPTLLYCQLQGMGYPSYSGRNYDFMRMHTPGLTKLYIAYSAFWFAGEILLAFVLMLMTRGKRSLLGKEALFLLSNALLLLGILVFRGAGVMDYKMGLFFPTLWLLFVDKFMAID